MKIRTAILSATIACSTISLLHAQDAQAVANKAAQAAYYQGDDGRAKVAMSIVDKQGRERSREFTILRRDDGEDLGEQQFYVFFRAPADVADTAFLVQKRPNTDDDRWLYLPALDLVRRIAASDERTSFVGSHFFYEDVSGRSPSEDSHTIEDVTDQYFVLKSEPKDPSSVEFAYFRSWIHKATFIPVKTEYYNAKDEPYRTYEAVKVEMVDNIPTVVQSRMTDQNRGGSTTLSYSAVQYDAGLKSSIFAERYLRNPPTDALEF